MTFDSDGFLKKMYPGAKIYHLGYPPIPIIPYSTIEALDIANLESSLRERKQSEKAKELSDYSLIKGLELIGISAEKGQSDKGVCGTCKYKKTCDRDSIPSECYDAYNADRGK